MKVQVSKAYVAFDGKRFASRADCEAHENSTFFKQFTSLKLPRIEATLDPQTDDDRALAQAVETWASRIRVARVTRGEHRPRKPRPNPAQATANAEPLAAEQWGAP
jgi:hypothetical protein